MVSATARKDYPPEHWLRDGDPEIVLQAGARQQALTYSRVKTSFLFELLGDLDGARLLDHGCGCGFFALEAARRGASLVVGADARPTALAGARLLARRAGFARSMAFVAAESAVFQAGARFDAICLRDVIEHVADDLGLLRSLAGLLAPGGRLVLATQNACSLNFLLEGGFQRLLMGRREWMGWDPTHLRFYTPRSLAALLREAGLRPHGWRGAYILPHKLPLPGGMGRRFLRIEPLAKADAVLGRLFPTNRLGWSLMAGATA